MAQFAFRKSSHSSVTPDGECVEVATNVPAVVAIRDSKQPTGPVLSLAPAAWTRFLAGLS
ncbi:MULTISPECIES: DUF397 domain-containing protein [Streptomyces]|uniref:DUF397 domain-containing protein n=1 Tax=Streptomyces TaxID=1883 RepID=UPI0004C489F9|nr:MULTISPECIES: DUF397 domain-containing protein [unclassified Streptomyces]MCU4749303.1 DUF397 domain-containing protein [Streptomyces sp. G-5]